MQRHATAAERLDIIRPQRQRAVVTRQRLVEPLERVQRSCRDW